MTPTGAIRPRRRSKRRIAKKRSLQRWRGPPVKHESEIERDNRERIAAIEAEQAAARVERWGADPPGAR